MRPIKSAKETRARRCGGKRRGVSASVPGAALPPKINATPSPKK